MVDKSNATSVVVAVCNSQGTSINLDKLDLASVASIGNCELSTGILAISDGQLATSIGSIDECELASCVGVTVVDDCDNAILVRVVLKHEHTVDCLRASITNWDQRLACRDQSSVVWIVTDS